MAYKQDWRWWRDALVDPSKIGTVFKHGDREVDLRIHEGTPQSGFYRTKLFKAEKENGKRPEPVSIFQNEHGHYVANRGVNVQRTITDPVAVGSLWLRVCRNPIPHEVYKSVMAGGLWPDEPPALQVPEKEPLPTHSATADALAADITEEWLSYRNTGCSVSNLGRVRAANGNQLATHRNREGYVQVTLNYGGERETLYVHQMVARAFLGEAPTPTHEVDHRDKNLENNRVDNLRWVTGAENLAHREPARGEDHGRSKLTAEQVLEIKTHHLFDKADREIATLFGVGKSTISDIRLGKTWGHIGEAADDEQVAAKQAELDEEERLAAQFLAKPIATQDDADKASEWANRVSRLGKWFNDEYWRINRPLVDRQNEIRRTLLDPSKEANGLAQRLVRATTDYLSAQQRKADEAAAAARRAQEEAARAAEKRGEEPLPLAHIEPAKVTLGGATGRRTTLAKKNVAVVTDYVALATFLITGGKVVADGVCNNPDLKIALDKAAQKIVEAGAIAPGMHSEEKAVARR